MFICRILLNINENRSSDDPWKHEEMQLFFQPWVVPAGPSSLSQQCPAPRLYVTREGEKMKPLVKLIARSA